MKIFAKISYSSLHVVLSVIQAVADLIYQAVCFLDRWLADHEL